MPADHRRKAEITARMALTGESRRHAAWAVANPELAGYEECAGWGAGCECMECTNAPVSMCQECLYVFHDHPFEPEDGSCPNGCTDYLESKSGRRLNAVRLEALGPVPKADRTS
ncbi:hypothetical protein [Streptomyces sp. NRRL B-24484]|uniref:hypothetical protein n=1 Tax=Streptomyces sp. NRRL B-24484 TaxID=1463833 RepID=UPI000AE00EE7|nr:hypothetical protein [Streptomyces sp. NRRL B-24484]